MREFNFYAERIKEAEQKVDRLANKLANATNYIVRSMISYDLFVAEAEEEAWNEEARGKGCYVI